MKRIIYLSVYMLCCLLFSCQSDEQELSNVGYLTLSVGQDISTDTKAPVYGYTGKQIGVQIVNSKNEVVKETDNWEEWKTTPIELQVGTYTIKASSVGFDGSEAAWEAPYYAASQEVTIAKNKTASVKMTCTLANVKVTVHYEKDLLDAFQSVAATVNDKPFPSTETRSCYFPVGKLTAEVTLISKSGMTYSKKDSEELSVVKDAKARDHYIFNYKLAESGNGNVTVKVDPTTNKYEYTFTIGKLEKDCSLSANAWSNFACFTAADISGTTADMALKFQYRKKGEEAWTDVAAKLDGKNYITDKITGLTPATTYEYQLVGTTNETTSIIGRVATFTTEIAIALINGNFDEWNKNEKGAWFAGTVEEASSKYSFWDSGNVGAATMSKNPTEPAEGEYAYSGKSASLKSQYVGLSKAGKFAAGNLYTGHYCQTYISGGYGARIRFGQPFTSRPTALKGVYKYTRGTKIDYGTDPYKTELQNSGGDRCAIYIVLTDNEGLVEKDGIHKYAFEIDNHAEDQPDKFIYKSTIDFSKNNPHVIAYGTLSEEESKGAATYTPFTIKLKYRDLTRKPKYIIVVASASMYGDFFTGSTDSQMYIDNFELDYEGEPVIE